MVEGSVVWGGQSRTKFFRFSSFVAAYGSPGKYWLICVGPLAVHLVSVNFFFLAMAYQRREKERQV